MLTLSLIVTETARSVARFMLTDQLLGCFATKSTELISMLPCYWGADLLKSSNVTQAVLVNLSEDVEEATAKQFTLSCVASTAS